MEAHTLLIYHLFCYYIFTQQSNHILIFRWTNHPSIVHCLVLPAINIIWGHIGTHTE